MAVMVVGYMVGGDEVNGTDKWGYVGLFLVFSVLCYLFLMLIFGTKIICKNRVG